MPVRPEPTHMNYLMVFHYIGMLPQILDKHRKTAQGHMIKLILSQVSERMIKVFNIDSCGLYCTFFMAITNLVTSKARAFNP